VTRDELRDELRRHALLEGDFVLRSGRRSRWYLDKYRFATVPAVLAALGEEVAATVARAEPEAVRLAAPELGAVVIAAAASLASGLPFVIVRSKPKTYGTANRIEGVWEQGERVCLVEDVVTTGGAAIEAVQALRDVGLECRAAVCVVDRGEGGVDELARRAVRLHPLYDAAELLESAKTAGNPHR
jgi:orotate phosphoribosyltransferase